MSVALGLLLLFLLLDLAAFVGWAPTSREPRDWERAGSPFEPAARSATSSRGVAASR